jgi:hypothetical protein
MKDWAVMDAEGVLPRLMEYAGWFTELVVPDHATIEEKLSAQQSFVTFAAASIARLKARGVLETPAGTRLVPILTDPTGKPIDEGIPEELMEHAAEMFEYRNGGGDEPR